MSDDLSPVLSLPLIQPAQAQKHVTHNEALRLLDVLVQPAVASRSIATPPGFPAQGGRWIVASGATGAWAGHEGAIALHDQGAWVFLAPQPGWQVQVIDEGAPVHWTGTAWLAQADLPQRFPRIGVATDADAANRLAVASPATLFTHVGAGHQLKLNKAAAADTASLLFQTGWSGRAEMGTAGSDDFAIKVSPDGSTWTTALSIAAATGTVSGAAIAQLPADTTAGRLFAFGNYVNQTGTGGPWGLGASHAVNVPDNDANAITRAGFYRVGSSSTVANVPDTLFGGVILHIPYSATYSAQTYIMTNGAAGLMWVRHRNNGVWSAWRRVWTDADFALTSGPLDATANRLLKVGAFGLGVTGEAPLLGNIDATNTPSGLYRTTSSSLGEFPAGSNLFGHVIVHRHNAGTVWQTYAPVGKAGGSAGKLWHRIYNPLVTSWLPWRLVYDQGTVLGTVSQSGGVPTGALMQGNASAAAPTGGWTERLADGFQTVHHSLTSSASANTTWTYNSAFLAGSSPVITAQPIGDADYRVRIVSRTETACVFSIRDGADNRVAVPVDLTARGRWSNMA